MTDHTDPELWSCEEHCERITAQDMDEAIEEFLDDSGQWGGKLTAYGWVPMTVPETQPDWEYPLEHMIEQLDEEYGNPDEGTQPNEAMIEAAKSFAAVVRSNYKPWACEIVKRVEVDVAEWIAKHRPDWLGGRDD